MLFNLSLRNPNIRYKNGDVCGISDDKLFSMMKKLGLKLGRGEFAALMVTCDPKQTYVIHPEKFVMLLLDL